MRLASVSSSRIIDQIGNDTAGITESHLDELTDANCIVTMSFAYMVQVRKDLVRNALGYPISKFCTWETPTSCSPTFQRR